MLAPCSIDTIITIEYKKRDKAHASDFHTIVEKMKLRGHLEQVESVAMISGKT